MASTQQNIVPASSEPSTGPSLGSGEPLQPHKVFILSRQRFTVVEVPVSARARDLALEVVERERLPMDEGKGGWIVFDCSAQFGIERPLREYEMITDVVNVRAHPKTDFLLIKRTELSPYLSLRSVPISSPALAGWVYVQDRKKKWNKRWLELRDHGLYHAKNEKGKDEMPICQISSFDVYLVDSSAVKMPKVNGFALRSQDPITMFEKPDQDYVHYFSLTDPAAHRDWVRAILNARSYILRQEKAILFQVESPLSSNQDAPLVLARRPAQEVFRGRTLRTDPMVDRQRVLPKRATTAQAVPRLRIRSSTVALLLGRSPREACWQTRPSMTPKRRFEAMRPAHLSQELSTS